MAVRGAGRGGALGAGALAPGASATRRSKPGRARPANRKTRGKQKLTIERLVNEPALLLGSDGLEHLLLALRARKDALLRVGEDGGESSSDEDPAEEVWVRERASERRLVVGHWNDDVDASDEPDMLREGTIGGVGLFAWSESGMRRRRKGQSQGGGFKG